MYLHCSTIDELSIKKFHVTVIKFLLYPTLSKLGEVGFSRLNIKWNRGVSLFTSTYMSCYAVFHLRFMHAVTLTKYQTSLGYHTVTFIFIFFFSFQTNDQHQWYMYTYIVKEPCLCEYSKTRTNDSDACDNQTYSRKNHFTYQTIHRLFYDILQLGICYIYPRGPPSTWRQLPSCMTWHTVPCLLS